MMSKKKTDSDYEVGYGKPPKEYRFKKGRSGNPKGRPKGSKNMATVMKDLLERPMTIRQNGQERRVTFGEAFVHRLAARSLEGSPRDMIALMKAIHDYMPEAVAKDQPPTRDPSQFRRHRRPRTARRQVQLEGLSAGQLRVRVVQAGARAEGTWPGPRRNRGVAGTRGV